MVVLLIYAPLSFDNEYTIVMTVEDNTSFDAMVIHNACCPAKISQEGE